MGLPLPAVDGDRHAGAGGRSDHRPAAAAAPPSAVGCGPGLAGHGRVHVPARCGRGTAVGGPVDPPRADDRPGRLAGRDGRHDDRGGTR